MASVIQQLKEKVLEGELISKKEALSLEQEDLEELCTSADQIRAYFCKNIFDICTIINGKSGKCSENCKFCAQSSYYPTKVEEYPLLPKEDILKQALYNEERGVLRYSVVNSGRRASKEELDEICNTLEYVQQHCNIALCVSLGLLDETGFAQLKQAGIHRIHNNLETSRRFFPEICSTHTYEDKIQSIKAAQSVGIKVCSGGIMGLGETVEDRVDMALDLRDLGVQSVPVNLLNPIAGTPFGEREKLTNQQFRRIIAMYRFILPSASIRLAGGRGLLPDKGELAFQSGANATISGDMLTTSGTTIQSDIALIEKLDYERGLWND